MTVYSVSGPTLTLLGNGSVNTGNLLVANSFNPITGTAGPVVVKVSNSSNADVAVVQWEQENTTYSFANVSGTASGSGANATFNVTVTSSAYTATVNAAGDGFIATETVTIAGTDVGGASPANDVTITVDTVGNIGQITGISVAGTQVWPQGTLSEVQVLPNSTDFVQVNGPLALDTYFAGNCASGNMFITPVQVLG